MKRTRKARSTPPKGTSSSHSWLQKSGELGLAVPQVVAHRLTRMALAGPVMSSRDKTEFTQMWTEKNQAFVQSWQAMSAQALRTQQALSRSWAAALFNPMAWMSSQRHRPAQAHSPYASGWSILNAGLEPVHRKAVANAKRLRRTPLVK